MLRYPCKSRRITSYYGPRKIGDGFHDGIDFGALVPGVAGDKIFAAHDGVVAKAYYSKSYGNCVIINGNGYSTLYAHLRQFIAKQGQFVKQGDVIGYMGTTGNSTGVHLHFEYRNQEYSSSYFKSASGKFLSSLDPMPFLSDYAFNDISDCYQESIDAIEYVNKQGLMTGYPDGSFKPKKPITREELAIILKRLDLS